MPPVVASLVVRDIIQAARDEHPSFEERRHPSAGLLRMLSRYQRRLAGRIVQTNRRILTASQDTALPLADFTVGITVLDYKRPLRVWALGPATSDDPDPKTEVDLVGWEAAPRYYRAAFLRDHVLYLSGTAADWVGFTGIRFDYVPELDTLTTLGATLALPNAAESCLVAYLAYRMAVRGQKDEGVEPPDTARLHKEWLQAEDEFIGEMAGQVQAETGIIREVW
jgi:hypothetical protein